MKEIYIKPQFIRADKIKPHQTMVTETLDQWKELTGTNGITGCRPDLRTKGII
jgi:hypothetical protein